MELRFDFVKFYEKKNSIYCHIKTSNRALECKIVSKAILLFLSKVPLA